jgi:urease accessory protein
MLSLDRPNVLPLVSQPPAGRAELTIVRGDAGRSVVSHAYATSPLRLLLPKNHGRAAWVYTSSFGGGLVDGDRLILDVDVGAGAAAFISSQASTKVYRSRRGTSAEVHARIGHNGLLVVAPDPVVCFTAARYEQTQHFDLAVGACLVLVDWLSSGRHAAGERWAFDDYRARVRARQDGRLVVHDSIALRAEDGDIGDRVGRFDVLATALVLGGPVHDHALEIVARVAQIPVIRRADALLAATEVGDGCLLRIAGTSVEHVGTMLREHLGFVPQLLGDDPWARKW